MKVDSPHLPEQFDKFLKPTNEKRARSNLPTTNLSPVISKLNALETNQSKLTQVLQDIKEVQTTILKDLKIFL